VRNVAPVPSIAPAPKGTASQKHWEITQKAYRGAVGRAPRVVVQIYIRQMKQKWRSKGERNIALP